MEFTTWVDLDICSTKLEEYLKTLGHDYIIGSVLTTQHSISWSLELETRCWGIKDVSTFVPDQHIDLNLEVYRPNCEDSEYFIVTLDLKNIQTEGASSMPLSPSVLSFDGKKWCLSF